MRIQLHSAAHISKIIGSRETFIEIPESSTLSGLLIELAEVYGHEFLNAICDETEYNGTGYDEKKAAILVNGRSAAAIGGVSIELQEGDDVLILPILGGG